MVDRVCFTVIKHRRARRVRNYLKNRICDYFCNAKIIVYSNSNVDCMALEYDVVWQFVTEVSEEISACIFRLDGEY